jgi:HSP20 family molecular chaperone IbpA
MPDDIEIDAQGDHLYIVVQASELEDVQTLFRVSPEVMDKLGLDDEEEVVRRTVAFLRKHQDVADFPDNIDLEDVMASYEDYVPEMTED